MMAPLSTISLLTPSRLPFFISSKVAFSTSVLHRNHTTHPSGYAFQLSIRDRDHPTRNTLHVGTFGFTAELFHTILFVTHVNILTSDRFGLLTSKSYRLPFLRYYRTFYYLIFDLSIQNNHRFGFILSLLYLWRKTPHLVRCYAFLNGWLLPSPPPSCLWDFTSFRT